MDWRNGSRQNPTGSAFRGISSRSRGRGRARGTSLNTRGGYAGTPGPSVTPPTPPPPPPPPPAQVNTPHLSNPSPASKPPSGRGSHQPPCCAPSLSHLDTSRAPVVLSIETSTTPGGRPSVARRTPPNFPGVPTPSLPPLKLDPSTPTIPGPSRPKTPRKRSHNRARSSSKGSTTQQVSSVPSTSSLKEKTKEAPPHMALNSGSSDVQSFVPRTDIDMLVERVRAMAMAGSAVDKEKDKEGTHIPHDGHIDWAGDEDDTLPDLDDWVRPKQVQHKEVEPAESNKCSEKPPLPPVEEVANLSSPPGDTGIQKTNGMNELEPDNIPQQAQDGRGAMKLKNGRKEVEVTAGKTKFRGRHGRKKSTVSEAIVTTLATQPLTGSEIQPSEASEAMGPTKSRPPLVHPLPPKPQLPVPPVRGFRSRGPVHTNQPVARTSDDVSDEASSATPQEKHSVEPPPTQDVKPVMETESTTAEASPESQVRKRAFDPSVDWANAPRSLEKSTIESIREAPEAPSFCVGHSPHVSARKRVFEPSVDWSKAPSVSDASPLRPTRSPVPSGRLTSSSTFSNPPPMPPHDRSRGPFPRHNISPRSSARTSPQPPLHTRSQINSPERSPNHWQDGQGPTHLRAHSSPQTGPGARTHASRPVITLDALSRISRTLGVPGATTPPRGPGAEVVVAD